MAWDSTHFRLPAGHGCGRLAHVQQLGGWQSLALAQCYTYPARGHLRVAVERLVQASDPLGQDMDRWQRTVSLLAAAVCKILIVLRGGVAEPG